MNYDEQEKQIAQQRARYLQQQDQQAPQGRMVGGRFVGANPLEYLAAGLRGYGGIKGEQQSNQELKDLGAQKQTAMAEALRKFGEKAKAQDFQGAYQDLAESGIPELSKFGMQGQLTSAQDQAKRAQDAQQRTQLNEILSTQGPQAAIAAGVPAETVKSYYESPNYGKSKVQFKDVGGQLVPVDEYGNTPTGVQPLSKTGNPFSDLVLRGSDGGMVPNAPLVGVKTDVARAGKPVVNVTNRIENKAAENIAGQVGPLLKESASAAEGAVRTLDAAGRIVSAIDKGNVIAGPLANTRVTVRQAAQLLGVGGKDNAEVLANTRSTIRGLAEMTLQGRKQMSGQGAITESESKLAEKAMSGDISDLTPAEIKQLAQASARAAQWTIQTHKTRSDAASKLPGMGGLMPFFNTPAMPGNMPEGFKVIE